MPYNIDQVMVALQKRKVFEGLFGSSQSQRQGVELKASALHPKVPIVDVDAPRTFRVGKRALKL